MQPQENFPRGVRQRVAWRTWGRNHPQGTILRDLITTTNDSEERVLARQREALSDLERITMIVNPSTGRLALETLTLQLNPVFYDSGLFHVSWDDNADDHPRFHFETHGDIRRYTKDAPDAANATSFQLEPLTTPSSTKVHLELYDEVKHGNGQKTSIGFYTRDHAVENKQGVRFSDLMQKGVEVIEKENDGHFRRTYTWTVSFPRWVKVEGEGKIPHLGEKVEGVLPAWKPSCRCKLHGPDCQPPP